MIRRHRHPSNCLDQAEGLPIIEPLTETKEQLIVRTLIK